MPVMDHIDWVVFFVALAAIPLVAWVNWRWWQKSRASELPRDWQSFWMIALGLACMVAIVLWYSWKFTPWPDIGRKLFHQSSSQVGPTSQPQSRSRLEQPT